MMVRRLYVTTRAGKLDVDHGPFTVRNVRHARWFLTKWAAALPAGTEVLYATVGRLDVLTVEVLRMDEEPVVLVDVRSDEERGEPT